MPQIIANGIPLEHDVHGLQSGKPLLLIMGAGAQMTRWPQEMVDDLAARGYRVIRHDNRDIGLSHKFEEAGVPDLQAVLGARRAGQKSPAPYLLSDMAADSVGLLDALGVDRAHIVGASMGGMIAQTIAAEYPARVLSLTSIMSTTGNPTLPPAKPRALERLMTRGPDPREDPDGYLAYAVAGACIMAGEGNPVDEAEQRAALAADVKRAYYPAGASRHVAAVVASGDRRPALTTITAPTVVIHGVEDPLVTIEGGHDTQAAIPGAQMHAISGMGHNLPKRLIPMINDLIDRAAARAREL